MHLDTTKNSILPSHQAGDMGWTARSEHHGFPLAQEPLHIFKTAWTGNQEVGELISKAAESVKRASIWIVLEI